MTLNLAPRREQIERLRRVALGREPADLVVSGGTLVDVFTEELLEGWGVAVANDRVVTIGPTVESFVGPGTELIDCSGDLIVPGLVESHTHLMRVGLTETAAHQVACGVTTSFLEMGELSYVCGTAGFVAAIEESRSAPGRVFLTVPPLSAIDVEHDGRLGTADDWIPLLARDGVAGVGEVYWMAVVRGHARTDRLIDAALRMGLAVEGHGAGARRSTIVMLAASGVGSDHEAIDADDVLTRLRLGYYVLARHGATRLDLDAIAPIWKDASVELGHLAFVTDGVEPSQLLDHKSLNWVVEEAVRLGVPLPTAVRMASRTPAERFGLGRWLGGLAPGMLADFFVAPRKGNFRPRLVYVGGCRPPLVKQPAAAREMLDTVNPHPQAANLFRHPGRGRWRAMELVAPLVTREIESDGSNAVVACSIDRLGSNRSFRGLVVGAGISGGAVALSSGWDSTGVTAVGDRSDDLAIAVKRVADMHGGAAVVSNGRVLGEWRAELGGVQSLAPIAEVVDQIAAVNGALKSLCVTLPNPLLSFDALTSATVPHLRIWPGGYFRLRDGVELGLDW